MGEPDSVGIGLLKYQVAEMQKALIAQAEEIRQIEERNAKREKEREDREKKWLTWGVMTVGGVAVTLGGVIWTNLNAILAATK